MNLTQTTNTTDAERSAIVNKLVSSDSELGLYRITLTGTVGHMSAWFSVTALLPDTSGC